MAPSIDASSSGDDTAARAASSARFSPLARADAHQRRAGLAHDRPHVGEVEVDEAGNRDQVGDPLDALAQHVVGQPERVDDRRLLVDDLEQTVVLDHDQRVDVLAQVADALLGLLGAPAPLERERPRDDTDGECADLRARARRRIGARSGAGAASFAGGDEDHVGALERLLQLVAALHGGLAA